VLSILSTLGFISVINYRLESKGLQNLNLKFKIFWHQSKPVSKLKGLRKKQTPDYTNPPELSNAVPGIQSLLAKSFPSATQGTSTEVRTSVLNPLLTRFEPAAECPRDELDTLFLAASDSLVADEQDRYTPWRRLLL